MKGACTRGSTPPLERLWVERRGPHVCEARERHASETLRALLTTRTRKHTRPAPPPDCGLGVS